MMLDFRQRLLTTTLLVGAGVLSSPAFAQQPPTSGTAANTQSTVPDQNVATNPGGAPPTGDVTGQPTPTQNASGAPVQSANDIIITGTRIPQPNLTSAAPVTVVTNQDVKLSGSTRIEDVLNSLPSVQANQSSGVSNGATGTAYVDLRDLGPKRTLVLINGRRLVPGDPNSTAQAADLNFIPSSLIKRVDVLTGGASSVYGADAVAGVVNFIMDTNFTGIRLDGQYSFYQHDNDCPGVTGTDVCTLNLAQQAKGLAGFDFPRGSVADGGAFDGTISLGAAFDDNRGHAMGYFGYRRVKAVLQQRRDYSACGLSGGGKVACGGSFTNALGNGFINHTFTTTTTTPNGATHPTTVTGATTVVGVQPGAGLGFRSPSPLYNFNPTNYFQRPDERYTGGVFADYEITPAIHPYMEFMFMDDHTLAQIAPSGDFGNTFLINCDNPFLSNAPGSGAITGGVAPGNENPDLTAQQLVCNPDNLIVGFSGGFPVAAGAGFAPGLGFPAGTPPVTFTDAAGNQFNQAFFNLLRRNVEGGNRIADLKHTEWRGVLGTRGDLSKVWSYDAYFQYGRTDYAQVYRNELSTRRLNEALNVVAIDPVTRQVVTPTVDPVTGQNVFPEGTIIECRSVLDNSDPSCVPFDIFTGNGPSAAAINFLNVFGVITGTTNEQVADANFTGALGEMGIQSPWADEGVGVNFGTEYRKESLDLNPDQEFQTGDLTGQGAPTLPVSGAFRVLEVFGETQIPIIAHSFIDELSLAAGYRKSWYKTQPAADATDPITGAPILSRTYSTDTYKLSAEFAPVRDVRFRAAYNRAVRAPNIQELFAPQFVGLDGSTDPCADKTITAADFGCIAQGMGVGSRTPSNPAAQYNGLLGGNPNLNPEKATTKTVGVVLQPRFLPRFAATIDWYDIKVKGAIQGFGADAILNNCTNNATATFTPASCALIHRAPGGSLWLSPLGFVTDLPNNVGSVETRGIDGNISYSHRLGGLGTLSASAVGTWVDKYVIDDGLDPEFDCAGLYGSVCGGAVAGGGGPLPHWRHKLRVGLQMPNGIGISGQWRYIGKVDHERTTNNVVLTGTPPLLNPHVSAQSYFDLAGTFTVGDHYNFRLGVNNILDKSPPLFTSSAGSCAVATCNGNTYGGTYDTLGRYIFAGATLNF